MGNRECGGKKGETVSKEKVRGIGWSREKAGETAQ